MIDINNNYIDSTNCVLHAAQFIVSTVISLKLSAIYIRRSGTSGAITQAYRL